MIMKNIVLIGFMGTGKTTVAKLLAQYLKKKYISTDKEIEELSGKKIQKIFKEEGEIGFREKEIKAIKKVAHKKNAIIDCGGGVVLNKINIDRLKLGGVIFLLKASPETILKRINKEKGVRPLLAVNNSLATIKKLLQFRQPFYNRAADYIIKTDQKTPEMIARKIIKIYYEHMG